jgi:hypothetical protein
MAQRHVNCSMMHIKQNWLLVEITFDKDATSPVVIRAYALPDFIVVGPIDVILFPWKNPIRITTPMDL